MVAQRNPRVAGSVSAARHPLRRRVDNVEVAILTALAVAFVVIAPLAAFVAGRTADTAALRAQRAEQQSWRPVTAVTSQSAAAGEIGLDGEWGAAFVRATWPLPGGGQRTGQLPVPLNARAGLRVAVWITASGQLTRPPLTPAEVQDREGSSALTAVVGLAVLLGLAGIAVRVAAGRRRLAGWERAWEAADPCCAPKR